MSWNRAFAFRALIASTLGSSCLVTAQFVSEKQSQGYMHLASASGAGIDLLVSNDEYDGVIRAANDLALDIGRVLGTDGTVKSASNATVSGGSGVTILGTIGSSAVIDELVDVEKLDVAAIDGEWESYIQQVVSNPIDGVEEALVIAGSDRRGSIYGLYALSEAIGVSPWYWWANVPIKTKSEVWIRREPPNIQGPPSIKYRGIFLNDEFQLIGWAEGRFPRADSGGYFTGDFYQRVFELLLRLRANYLWPGMKMQEAFYVDDPDVGNGFIADNYGIVIGRSHHEPAARSYYEQMSQLDGDWDWSTNEDNVTLFMDYGIERAKNWETMFTMGMRGEGDTESPTLTAQQLEFIIGKQREMIKNHTGKLEEVPQVWALYKEVGKYWQAGMDVPEDITLLWTDDNYGNLLRVPLANETSRAGGHGVYYHIGYVGDPRSYIWMDTNQLAKIWEQMHYAYERNMRQVWLVNVQDLKPYEVPTNFFLDMAYDMSFFADETSVVAWSRRWTNREFGSGIEDATANIQSLFGRLAYRRKWEMYTMDPFPFSTTNYDEAEIMLREWDDLAQLAQRTHKSARPAAKDAFFELVVAPVLAGQAFNRFFIRRAFAELYLNQSRTSTNNMAALAREAFTDDTLIEEQYDALFDGKFEGFMSCSHFTYLTPTNNSDEMPALFYISNATTAGNRSAILGVSVQGNIEAVEVGQTINMGPVDPYMPEHERRWLEVFTRWNGTASYEITSNASYVSVSPKAGELHAPGNHSDVRSTIEVDWLRAPEGASVVELKISQAAKDTSTTSAITALLPVKKKIVPSSFRGFVESNGVVSIDPGNYTTAERKNGASYIEIPFYGGTRSGMKLFPVTTPSQNASDGPKLTYGLYTFTAASAKLTFVFGATLNLDPLRPLKFAYTLDSEDTVTKQLIDSYSGGSLPSGWSDAVIVNSYTATVDVEISKGEHTLSLWLLEPGVVLQKVWFDLGGKLSSYLGPPASRKV